MNPTLAVQCALLSRGYDIGPAGADGVLGRATIAAVAKFQADAKLAIRFPGTIGPKTLAALDIAAVVDPPQDVAWLAEARRFLRLHERRDAKVLNKALRLNAAAIPWCGAFVAMVFGNALPSEPLPANPLGARNWLKFGAPISGPQVGAVAVFERPGSSWAGHVGFVVGHDRTHLHILGGNQSDSVSVARIAKSRLLGLRWPSKAEAPPTSALALSTISATVTSNEA